MGIKRQKASVIMQSLLIDLAATGANDALAIVRRAAWFSDSPLKNLQDALEQLKDAEREVPGLISSIESAAKEESIDATWKTSASAMIEPIGAIILDIEKGIKLIHTSTDYSWDITGSALLRNLFPRSNDLVKKFAGLYKKMSKLYLQPGSKIVAVRQAVYRLQAHLLEAQDEIKNAMEAAGIDPAAAPSAAPAAAPSGASAVEKDKAYMDYIFGAHKLLDIFLEEYASGELTPEQDAIIKRLIMDNADSKKLMSAYLKKDNQPELNKMIKDPNFSSKAKDLFDRIKVNITTATTELDKLGQL